jgi:hypothetical protein
MSFQMDLVWPQDHVDKASKPSQQVADVFAESFVIVMGLIFTKRVSDLLSGEEITIDLGEERHTDLVSDHKDPNPVTLAPRLLWLSTM